MFLFRMIRTLAGLYGLMQMVHFALPYLTKSQQPWMAVMHRLCEPGIKIGNLAVARFLPDRRFKVEMGGVAAALICWVIRLILGIIV